MVSRYTFGTRFVPAVILAALLCCSTQIVSAQELMLAFSTTASTGTDGFNNGVLALPASSAVPVAIGVFDAQTGIPSPAPADIHLVVELLDATGLPHPQLSVYGTSTATMLMGSGSVLFTSGLRWKGAMPTSATVRVRDLANELPTVDVIVTFDPMLTGDIHVVARIAEDRNRNGIYDAPDILRSDATMQVCQLGGMILVPFPDGTYRLDAPGYNGGFPLRILPVDRPDWRSATGGTEGLEIEGYGTYTPVYLVQRVDPQWVWSGVVHRTDLPYIPQDSSVLVRSFTGSSGLTMELQASAWRMTSMLTPAEGMPGTFSMQFYGGACREEQKTGELQITWTGDREIVTPVFDTPYDLLLYRNGVLVFGQYGRTGPAVSLARTVRRWFARDGVLGIEELQYAPVGVVGGAEFAADQIVFRPAAPPQPTTIGRIVCTGNNIDELEIFDHEIRAFGFHQRPLGTMLPAQTDAQKLRATFPDNSGGMRISFPPNKIKGFTVGWGEPAAAGALPQVQFSAYGGSDVFMHRLGAMVLDKNDVNTVVQALPLPGSTATVQVQAFLAGIQVTSGTANGDTAAFYTVWPYRAGVTVGTCIVYRLQWGEPVIVQLADGHAVECDELCLVYPTTALPARVLSHIDVSFARYTDIPIYEGIPDSLLPALPLTTKITLTGEVYEDKNKDGKLTVSQPPQEIGRPGRVVVFEGDPAQGQIVYDTTDAQGFFFEEFDPLLQGWAPERISILPAPAGCHRTSPDYDLVAMNQCNKSLSDLNFGEFCEYDYIPGADALCSGNYDDFYVNETETSAPDNQLQLLVGSYGYEHTDLYDEVFRNRFFLHTFEDIRPNSCVFTQVNLEVHMRACAGDAYNDRIVLQACGRRFWSADLAKLAADGVWHGGKTEQIILDIGDLPVADGGTIDALPYLYSGQLDLIINDDTQLDYALLSVGFECPPPDTIVTGVGGGQAAGAGDLHVFPNPSAGTGTLSFTLPRRETVSIVVYDLLNREVARLLNGVSLGAGYQALAFVLPSLAPGRYTIVVRTAEHSRMQSLWIGP